MDAKEIITNVEALSQWSVEVDPVKDGKAVQKIILELKETMRKNDLDYLTAPQIGYERRLFCMRFGKNDYRTFINPAVENNIGMTMSRETCCSIPGKTFIIPRFNKVKFYYTTPLGKIESANLFGRAAYVFQHAMDHINGMLVSDIGLEIDDMFDNASEEDKEEVIKMYVESLDLRHKDLQKQIEEDNDLKQLDDAIKFINSVNDGSTILDNTIDKKG